MKKRIQLSKKTLDLYDKLLGFISHCTNDYGSELLTELVDEVIESVGFDCECQIVG